MSRQLTFFFPGVQPHRDEGLPGGGKTDSHYDPVGQSHNPLPAGQPDDSVLLDRSRRVAAVHGQDVLGGFYGGDVPVLYPAVSVWLA